MATTTTSDQIQVSLDPRDIPFDKLPECAKFAMTDDVWIRVLNSSYIRPLSRSGPIISPICVKMAVAWTIGQQGYDQYQMLPISGEYVQMSTKNYLTWAKKGALRKDKFKYYQVNFRALLGPDFDVTPYLVYPEGYDPNAATSDDSTSTEETTTEDTTETTDTATDTAASEAVLTSTAAATAETTTEETVAATATTTTTSTKKSSKKSSSK